MAKFLLIAVSVFLWAVGVEKHLETSPTPQVSPQVSPEATPIPTPILETVKSTPTPTPVSQTTGDWVYPGSTASGEGKWISSDNPQTITDWYKNKIKQTGMYTTSFVQTNTNDNVLNKLAGAGNGLQIAVEISKSPGANQTAILVTLDK